MNFVFFENQWFYSKRKKYNFFKKAEKFSSKKYDYFWNSFGRFEQPDSTWDKHTSKSNLHTLI